MRISDWSSDVCSSDLICRPVWVPWFPPMPLPRHRLRRRLRPPLRQQPPSPRQNASPSNPLTNRLPWFHPCPNRRHWLSLHRSEEHTSELQSLMRISYAVFCLKKKHINNQLQNHYNT